MFPEPSVPRKNLTPTDMIIALLLGVLSSIIGTFIFYVFQRMSNQPDASDVPIRLQNLLTSWDYYVVAINVFIVCFSIILFGLFVAFNHTRTHYATSFGIWSVAWVFQLWQIIAERCNLASLLVYFDAASTTAILIGCMIIKERLNRWTASLIAIPIALSFLPNYFNLWLIAFANFFVLLWFAMTLFDFHRDRFVIPAYLMFASYAFYAAAQLLFPLMKILPAADHGLMRTMGYTLGAVSKGGGAFGLLLVSLMNDPQQNNQMPGGEK